MSITRAGKVLTVRFDGDVKTYREGPVLDLLTSYGAFVQVGISCYASGALLSVLAIEMRPGAPPHYRGVRAAISRSANLDYRLKDYSVGEINNLAARPPPR